MLRRFAKKRVILALSVVAALVVTGAAVAFFTSTGTGQAQVGSAENWTVTPSGATGGPMFPGSGTSNIAYTIKNPGSDSRHLGSTSAAVASLNNDITSNGTEVTGCLASWFAATMHTDPAPADVAGGATVDGSVDVTMTDTGVSQDACQGKTPDITISAQ